VPLAVCIADYIEPAFKGFAAEPNAGLIVVPDSSNSLYREAIYRLAIQYRLPAVYFFRTYAAEGGLIAHGVDTIEINRGVATYVDPAARSQGERSAGAVPTNFVLVVNLKINRLAPCVAARRSEEHAGVAARRHRWLIRSQFLANTAAGDVLM
jgi:hypothetical protein